VSIIPKRISRHRAGFTLLELMVATTIMLLLVGGGLASYFTFDEKQSLRSESRALQAYLRTAKTNARSGLKPDDCGTSGLEGYQVQVFADSQDVTLSAVCENGTFQTRTYMLGNSVVVVDPVTITFNSLYGGTTGGATIRLRRGSRYYSFDVTDGGEIMTGALEE